MSRREPLPPWMKVVLAAEAGFALLFWLWSWSHTVSLAQGRAASVQDIVALAIPFALVVLCGILAIRLWRAGKREMARGLVFAPLPLALLVFMTLGAIL